MRTTIQATGIHSLFNQSEWNGTPHELHVPLCDLDSKRALEEPQAFKVATLRAMRSFGLVNLYAFETLKGIHLFSPWLNTRRHAERFEESFHEWGSDGAHRRINY